MAWLDALRGIAASAVVLEHAFKFLLPEAREPVKAVFEPGWYGVTVFFLVSGFIVPASLERRGSVRAFWVSRFFRLYPLFGVCVAGVALLVAAGWDGMHIWWDSRPVPLAVGHLTMLQNLLYVPNLVNVLWTLSYEMAFYLLVTAMFTLGVHRRSTAGSLGFAVAAVLGAGVLPATLLSSGGSGRMLTVVLLVATLVAAGLAAVIAGSDTVRRAGAILIGVTVLGLLAVNQTYPGPGQGLLILATMFAGTALYRAEQGQIPGKQALWVALVPLAGLWLAHGEPGLQLAIAAAWLTFGAGMALRHRRVPRLLAWLGLVSYSIYLLHPLLLEGVERIWPDPLAVPLALRLPALAGVLALLLGLSTLTWHFVEAPALRLGRRLSSGRARHAVAKGPGG
ncbi:Peptidoglycan/LPS O-acetylase OafA/YrhL, contains acyltransferase and SGNH-hydrolase domains [Nonomuraea jiangxiensis]|uniref:Peptidoglycan/LPS O-acetylase OafA/YrhL, contains acyltransferase and SGNH-hydrolase domains n=2 Tax=Nonomuraea jiangxiensis TaxID=633440 RepID=A0A1G9BDW1_9ACTN|nr:Peptidoglycan/LPS O-acetylase OafA/YrhL, contains acyltransferase and SGNH-hydrolase domains [Nonomuraea jiangxiensis]